MTIWRMPPCCALLAVCCFLTFSPSAGAAPPMSLEELKAKVETACRDFQDLTMQGAVTYKNKEALAKLDPAYARLYEFSTATVYLKPPDKLRMDGKLGMVKFEYIINGPIKIFRAPKVRVNKKEDYGDDPAKLQGPLDLGIVTPTLWLNRRLEVLDDPDAQAAGEIKLSLRWMKGNMQYLAWLDAASLTLKRFEKRDAASNLLARAVYSNHQRIDGVVWVPGKVEVFAGDGTKAGTSELVSAKANTGLQDSFFQ